MAVNQFGVEMDQYAPNENNIFSRAGNWFKDKWDNFKMPSGQDITDSYGQNQGTSILAGTETPDAPSLNIQNPLSGLKGKIAENNQFLSQQNNQGGAVDYTGPQNLDYSGETPGGVMDNSAGDTMSLMSMGAKGDKQFDSSNFLNANNQNMQTSDFSNTAYSAKDMASIDANMAAEAQEPTFDNLMAKTTNSMNNQVGTDVGIAETIATEQDLMGGNEENGQTDLTLEDELLTQEANEEEIEEPGQSGFKKVFGGIGTGLSGAGDSLLKSGGFQYGSIFGDR